MTAHDSHPPGFSVSCPCRTIVSGTAYGNHNAFVFGNGSQGANSTYGKCSVVVKNCENVGSIFGTTSARFAGGASAAQNKAYFAFEESGNKTGTITVLADSELSIENVNGEIVIGKGAESAKDYILTLYSGTRFLNPNTENSTYAFSIRLSDISWENGKYNTGLHAGKVCTIEQYAVIDGTFNKNAAVWKLTEAGEKYTVVSNNGTYYYIFDFADKTIYFGTKVNGKPTSCPVSIGSACVTDYSENGSIIGAKTIKL